jgi:hypothetical protein
LGAAVVGVPVRGAVTGFVPGRPGRATADDFAAGALDALDALATAGALEATDEGSGAGVVSTGGAAATAVLCAVSAACV